MNILMIGCGKMGGAMLRCWQEIDHLSFTVADPADQDLPAAVTHVRSDKEIDNKAFDLVVIALKPQIVPEAMPAYSRFLKEETCVISIAAGLSLQKLTGILGNRPLVRVMPNLPALIGEGVTGLYANKQCEAGHKHVATNLMEAVGMALWVDSEDELDRLTAVSGSGPGYIFQVMESFVAAAEELGFPSNVARDLVIRTLSGAANMAAATDESLSTLRQSVTSKKGTTEAGLNVLRQDGMLDNLFGATTFAAYKRAVELR
ncbi:MAG: pyrroline-5-carboxylate reductase [Alphaproteobacteria bacterium]|nr:pyrroline-5-carboxylate reductase [Alphaproteobacteria bacterium]